MIATYTCRYVWLDTMHFRYIIMYTIFNYSIDDATKGHNRNDWMEEIIFNYVTFVCEKNIH